MKRYSKVEIERMREDACLFCEVEGFDKEADAVLKMSDEEVAKFFFELFPNKTQELPFMVQARN